MISENRDASTGLVLRVGTLADFGQKELECARQLLDLAFEGTLSDADWKQGLGGVHVLAWREDLLVGHASLIPGACCTAAKRSAPATSTRWLSSPIVNVAALGDA